MHILVLKHVFIEVNRVENNYICLHSFFFLMRIYTLSTFIRVSGCFALSSFFLISKN